MRTPSSATLAGLLALVSPVFYIAVWYTYLLNAIPPGISASKAAIDQLKFSFSSESAAPWVFALLAALPVLCLCVGVAYLAGFASSRHRTLILLAATGIAGLGAVMLNDWPSVLLLATSAYYGWRYLNCAFGTRIYT